MTVKGQPTKLKLSGRRARFLIAFQAAYMFTEGLRHEGRWRLWSAASEIERLYA